MTWDVQWSYGSINLPQIGWWLDAHRPVSRSFVSHAHFDHMAKHREILCSRGTARLMRDRLPAERLEWVLEFGEAHRLGDECVATLHPAGHIFGSAQCLFEHARHGRLLYTGDFKLRSGSSAEPCATPSADVVIMETTFGKPHYTFPPQDQVLAAIVAFCRGAIEDGDVPILFGYSLGKSQEILSQLEGAKLPIMLHPQAVRMTTVYEELGQRFPDYATLDPATSKGHVIIAPPQSANSKTIRQIKRRRTAMLSGWAMDPSAIYRYQCDAMFPLSDHADYPDLMAFVKKVRPRLVLTTHGFATEFARDLRLLGIEAWALGADNQLEIGLDISCSSPLPCLPPSTPAASDVPIKVAASFSHWVTTAEAIKATSSTRQKVALLSGYFAGLPADAGALAALYFTGRPFPQASPLRLNTGWSVMKRAVLNVTHLNDGDWRTTYRRFADSGDTAEVLLTANPSPHASTDSDFTLDDLHKTLESIAAARGPVSKLELLEQRLRHLKPAESKYLLKIISGDLRIGLRDGLVLEAIATSVHVATAEIRSAHMLSGDIARTFLAARQDRLAGIALDVFTPVQFMLASPEPDAASIVERLAPPVWLEDKYDGIRCQLHKRGVEIRLFSRDLNDITEQFPDLINDLRHWDHDVILDGELLAWRDDRALPFAELQKRLGRRGDDLFLGAEVPISFLAYDLLWADGAPLLDTPLRSRRDRLETCFIATRNAAIPDRLRLAPVITAQHEDEIDRHFAAARKRGNEGLMIKDPNSTYTPGTRGQSWLKLKRAFATLDVVVVAVEQGHGKRRGVLSDYTFAVRDDRPGAANHFLVLGKAYSGLTDLEIASLTDHFTAQTTEIKGRTRLVHPDTVIEVAFDSIQRSPRHDSGYALRFPRIARIRTDKTPAEIDTLSTCGLLAGEGVD